MDHSRYGGGRLQAMYHIDNLSALVVFTRYPHERTLSIPRSSINTRTRVDTDHQEAEAGVRSSLRHLNGGWRRPTECSQPDHQLQRVTNLVGANKLNMPTTSGRAVIMLNIIYAPYCMEKTPNRMGTMPDEYVISRTM